MVSLRQRCEYFKRRRPHIVHCATQRRSHEHDGRKVSKRTKRVNRRFTDTRFAICESGGEGTRRLCAADHRQGTDGRAPYMVCLVAKRLRERSDRSFIMQLAKCNGRFFRGGRRADE